MARINLILVAFLVTILLGAPGCGSSEETSTNEGTKPAQEAPAAQTAEKQDKQEVTRAQKIDTLNVDVKDTPKQAYDSRGSVPRPGSTTPSGKFSVQVGAYKMPDNAERVANLAKERFGKTVYTMPDKDTDLYKVYIGDFAVKDDARRFRDEMVQKYPTDYIDAWVSENPQK